MHEVGHTLGLRHNFRASRVYSEQQLADPEFTPPMARRLGDGVHADQPARARRARRHAPFRPRSAPTTTGPSSTPTSRSRPTDEAAELRAHRRAQRRAALAYGTDEDNCLGIDPETLQLDLGDDVVAFARKRIDDRPRPAPPPGDARAHARPGLRGAAPLGALRRCRRRPRRGHAGAPDRRRAHAARPARQRARPAAAGAGARHAARGAGADHAAACCGRQPGVSPALQRRLAPDFHDRGDNSRATSPPTSRWRSSCSTCSARLLGQLMSDTVAVRLLDSADKADRPEARVAPVRAVRPPEPDVWSELAEAGDIAPPRRELQREHVNRVAGLLLRPQPAGPCRRTQPAARAGAACRSSWQG